MTKTEKPERTAELGEGRDRSNGRFTHTRETICSCGHALGEHSAVSANGLRECFADDCRCMRFRKKR